MNCLGAYGFTMAKKKVAMVKQYPPRKFISNYYELCNLVAFITLVNKKTFLSSAGFCLRLF